MGIKRTKVRIFVCLLFLASGNCLRAAEIRSQRSEVRSQKSDFSVLRPLSSASLYASKERMQWWNEKKFGLFIHWGPWSQTGQGRIFKSRDRQTGKLKITAEQVREYLDLYKTFNPVKFEPGRWARLAREAGMRYVVFTAKHADGFCNFDTKLTDYKITNPECPYSRSPQPDITARLFEAFRKEGLAIGVYCGHPNQHHPDGVWWLRHIDYEPDFVTKYPQRWHNFFEFEKGLDRELLINYGPIDIYWFDNRWPTGGYSVPYEIPQLKKDTTELIKMMHELEPDLIINNRGTDIYGDFATPEQWIPLVPLDCYWESNITISNGPGYWYKGPDADYKTTTELIRMLVDIASKGGNFLLNVGPKPDGTITQQETQQLKEMGQWLKVNGESIYGTTRTVFRELGWGKCTVKRQNLFLHIFDWPKDGLLRVPGLRNKITRAYLLADKTGSRLSVSSDGQDVLIKVGEKAPDPIDSVVVLTIAGKPDVDRSIRQDSEGNVELRAGEAEINGKTVKYYSGQGTQVGDYITNWTSVADWLSWELTVDKPGEFDVEITYACNKNNSGSSFIIAVNNQKLTGKVKPTFTSQTFRGKQSNLTTDVIGKVALRPGIYKLSVKPEKIAGEDLMYLRAVTLRPVGN